MDRYGFVMVWLTEYKQGLSKKNTLFFLDSPMWEEIR
jgi:hypothetical protein